MPPDAPPPPPPPPSVYKEVVYCWEEITAGAIRFHHDMYHLKPGTTTQVMVSYGATSILGFSGKVSLQNDGSYSVVGVCWRFLKKVNVNITGKFAVGDDVLLFANYIGFGEVMGIKFEIGYEHHLHVA